MRPLSSIATSCSYQVITSGATYVEISGNGRWHCLERECMRWVHHSDRDHVTIILRDDLGHRELRDLGKKGERRGELPSFACRHPALPITHLLGVKVSGKRWSAQVYGTAEKRMVYLGTFDDEISAGMARDRYIVDHGIKSPLNFPHMRELMSF